ncbi:MAG TPA: isoprenyl transferase [bacterium]|nr:isoprenyl transferase [bacterium]
MKKLKNLPVHIAVIMDGNGRWAKKRRLPRILGHREGAKSVRAVTEACAELGIGYLTYYAFSTENWKRPKKEVSFLMKLLNEYLDKEKPTLLKNNIRFNVIGGISRLPRAVREKISEVKKTTAKNTGLTMTLALNYGSKNEITEAVRKIAKEAAGGKIKPAEVNEKTIEKHLFTAGMPDPDLMIRTSGEMRLSNFLLWQMAYCEIYITPVLWPDFRKKELIKALKSYSARNRRFGGV